MRLVLLGPPGAGKGTQAVAIVARYGMPHVSTGNMLREAIAAGTALGERVRAIVDSGALVPDGLIGEVVTERLGREDARTGFLLDGFPRTLPQAEILEAVLGARNERLTAVIKIDLGDDEVVRRLSGRRTCVSCGALWHLDLSPTRRVGLCDACGGELRQREDDREEVIRRRLSVYHEQTAPLTGHYAALGSLRAIDGRGSREEVTKRIFAALEGGAAA